MFSPFAPQDVSRLSTSPPTEPKPSPHDYDGEDENEDDKERPDDVKDDVDHKTECRSRKLSNRSDGEDKWRGQGHLMIDPEYVEKCELLQIGRLNQWDYPIFELADQEGNTVLSKVTPAIYSNSS